MNLGSSPVHVINSPHVSEFKTVLDPPRGFWIKGTGFRTQPRSQGLLAFQYGGGRREDPGTQQKSRDWFVHGEWKFIQNGGQIKEWEDLGTRSWDLVKNKQNGGRGKLKEANNMNECTYKPQEYGRMI